jgi:hypothetical protein
MRGSGNQRPWTGTEVYVMLTSLAVLAASREISGVPQDVSLDGAAAHKREGGYDVRHAHH